MVHQTSQFRIPNPEFRILHSEFRIPHFEKNNVYRKLVFVDATSGSLHVSGPFDQNRSLASHHSTFSVRLMGDVLE